MRRISRAIVAAATVIVTTTALVPGAWAATVAAPATGAAPMIRVNQVGYPTDGPKTAYVMLPAAAASISFAVQDARGRVVYRGRSADDLGRWNAGYGAVYRIDFSALHRDGAYRILLTRPSAATSPTFEIAESGRLYDQLVRNGVRYFTSERDGGDVVRSVLDRQPANLTDRHAFVYADPSYDSSDNLLGSLTRIGGPVDVSGGWFDAGGGYEKFAYTGTYADALLLMAARDTSGQATLRSEATFGLDWIRKLWNPATKVMYIQVGIGNGNADDTIQGDYDYWFLPQQEDRLGAKPGSPAYFVQYRPVFEAAPPGQPVSPDLAGRFAAVFALGSQLNARTNPRLARQLLAEARQVYAMAKTTDVGQIVTTFPNDYYPGTQWKSDMLWGAAEIALADENLHAGRAQLRADLTAAARWARAYIAQGHGAGGDTLNLYDTGAVAEADLLRAMQDAHTRPVIAPAALLDDLAAQLRLGESYAKGDPFALGTALGASDASPHAFGLYITNALYRRYGGSGRYERFAQQQLNYALGANPWGTSFVVGAGTTFPHCMQSEIANLAGSLTGKGEIQLGATVDGPSDPANFEGLGTVDGMRACSAGDFAPFDSGSAAYEDDVTSWPSVEPADDYTAASVLAFALGGGHHPFDR